MKSKININPISSQLESEFETLKLALKQNIEAQFETKTIGSIKRETMLYNLDCLDCPCYNNNDNDSWQSSSYC